MTPVRYRILGPAHASDDDGSPIPLPGPRLRTLLTALAQHPAHPRSPQSLIDEVWADAPPQDAPAALQALIGRLRRALGKDAIASEAGGYRLTAAEEDIDLHVFERLVRQGRAALEKDDARTAAQTLRDALALWRGPALADLPDRTAATCPEALRLEAVRARADAELRLGRAHGLVPELRELTAAHPYDEQLHVLLIRALRDTGRGADALAAYEEVRRALLDGLGADPGPELRALHAELLAPPPAWPPGPTPEPEAAGPHTGGPPTMGPDTIRSETMRSEAPRSQAPQALQSTQAPQSTHVPPSTQPPRISPGPAGGPDSTPRPRAARTGNLRPRLNSFVGREPELDAIRSDLRRARLVTLTGPGGSGKTRLAEEAAAGLPQAWLAELALLDRPEAVPGAVVSALQLRETVMIGKEMGAPKDDPVALLIEHCAPRSELLILDNCEHVIDAAAELAETLLTHCPGLTILATSREPLGVPGELVRPVEPLLPGPAHQLFTERAATVRPGAGTVPDSAAVDEICRRLDGLPLAIELAAARLRMLTPRQIADRLDDRFRLLTSGSRTVLPRQQTLRAVVDWSWELLDEPERTVLREVSVFAGGWDLAAAEAVCTGPAADLIGALVDKSLIVATPGDPDPAGHGTGMRYRMLETIHEYATERAAEQPGARAAAEARHGAWVRALVEEAEPKLRSAEQLVWAQRLETDLDNIRAALYRAVAGGEEEQALALVLGMGWFWWLRNFRQEAMLWTDRVLRLGTLLDTGQAADGSPDRSGAVTAPSQDGARDLFDALGAHDPMAALVDAPESAEHHPLYADRMRLRMLHLFMMAEERALKDPKDARTRAYVSRIRDFFAKGGPDAARMPGIIWPMAGYVLGDQRHIRSLMDQAVANCREYGGDWEVGVALMFRTHMIVDTPGGMPGIDEDLAELRVLSRRAGDRWMRAQVCSAAGEAALVRSRLGEARQEYAEALRLADEVGAYAETPFLLARLAEVSYREGDRPAALATMDAASEAADLHGVPDSRAFIGLVRAHIALDAGDTRQARELVETAREESGHGTPPPQFIAGLDQADALVTAAEAGVERGLPKMAGALRHAVEAGCAEWVTASLTDSAARLVADLGDLPRAVRLLAAASGWRGVTPRPMPECLEAERLEAAARTALGPGRYESERTRGSSLTVAAVLEELADAVEGLGTE
ncbi:BTAD domain-containing putative transcriptional regulator [Streptomyces sp. NPDC008313]|uniref:AfsR/SARP family transcriptional regulator n=1 Tax=Streptomyces sp. NPDC008313 TaxID=3364826 RepID=UPI0036E16B85